MWRLCSCSPRRGEPLILRTRSGSNREYRAHNDRIPSPGQFGTRWTPSGQVVNVDRAIGLPAVFAAYRLVSESIGSLAMNAWVGKGADKKPLPKTWQQKRFSNPVDDQSAFEFWQDVAGSIEAWGNAFVRKVKTRAGAPVDAMWLLDPVAVTVWRDLTTGEKVFRYQPQSAAYGHDSQGLSGVEYTTSDVIHIRGLNLRGWDFGMSHIAFCRDVLGSALARTDYEGHLYANDSTPPGAITVPGPITPPQAEAMVARWKAAHQGVWNAGNPAVLGNGAKWETFGIPLKDAQFIESHEFTIHDVARMTSIPPQLLAASMKGVPPDVEQDSMRFLNFGLNPRLKRIEGAFYADRDFFAAGEAYPQFDRTEFVQADAATQAAVRHNDIQSGVLLADEARAEMGRPPLPDGVGLIPQITPVGGAPNPVLTSPTVGDTGDPPADS